MNILFILLIKSGLAAAMGINMKFDNEIKLLKSMEAESALSSDIEDAVDHGILVSHLVYALAKELKIRERYCKEIAAAGILHDIGKLMLGEYLYGRQEKTLNIEEVKYMRMHPKLGYEVLKQKAKYSDYILKAVYYHHENMDGSGYPDNLRGDEIPYGAKLLRPCDVFAALISERPYRSAFDVGSSMEMMIDEVKNFDMKIFLAFMSVVNVPEFATIKELAMINNEKSKKRNMEYKLKRKNNQK